MFPSAFKLFPLLGTQGPDAPILCPKTLPVLVMMLGLVMSWHMPGAQLRRALPGTQDSSKGSSQGLSMAPALSLAWSREFPSGNGGEVPGSGRMEGQDESKGLQGRRAALPCPDGS